MQMFAMPTVSIEAAPSFASLEVSQQSNEPQVTEVTTMPWGYLYTLSSGDIVEVGDSSTTDFKAMVKTIRGDCYFSLGWLGGTFEPTLNDLTVSFQFNNSLDVDIYPVEPSTRLPDGGIEYDIQLSKKPAQTTIDLDIDWQGITWHKIYGLDVEYDEAKCEEDFGIDAAPYTITPTSITGSDSEVYKTREEYEVNSYIGTALQPNKNTSIIGWNDELQQPITRTSLSRIHLYIHRGQMTDSIGASAWVEDINIDEQAKTITFTLPRDWLSSKDRVYFVNQVCGVDPAYTEAIVGTQDITGSMSDGTWTACDMADFGLSNTECVLEIILENQQKGTENLIGVRETSSAINRYVNIHECEPDGGGDGDTHCRMFVQADASGAFEAYSEDVSDTYFYIVGYWENVTFTEDWDVALPQGSGAWEDFDNQGGLPAELSEASTVYHFIATHDKEEAAILGVRTGGSALSRSVLAHEAENGGVTCIDFIVKSDASADVEIWDPSNANGADVFYYNAGYFGSGMDFTELWQFIDYSTVNSASHWETDADLSAYLDQDGRVVDVMCLNGDIDDPRILGVRGADSSANRYIYEHESEDNGTSTGELTGFSMSAQTDSNGCIDYYQENAFTDQGAYYLTGYIKPASLYSITNSPSSEGLGVVADSSTYYAYGSAPSNPVVDGECTFTITNAGATTFDVDMKITDFTGGTSWNIVSGSPSTNEVRVTAYYSGQNPASGLVLANTDAEFYDALAGSATIKWDFKFETGTLTDEANQHSATVTLTAVAED